MKQFRALIIFFVLLNCTAKTFASNDNGKIDAGNLIIGHITDSYSWHLFSVGEHHISIPLPVILIHDGNFDVFMSSKFHHGECSYKGYKIVGGGTKKEHIVCVDEQDNVLLDAEGNEISPIDLSITKTAAGIMLATVLLLVIFMFVCKSCKKNRGKAPKGLQSLMEILILFIKDQVVYPIVGEKRTKKYLPYILTLFFFIFFCNIMGLIPLFPGGVNVTGNICVTAVLALITFLITTFSGNKHYWKDIFNTPGVPWWLKWGIPIMPIVEFVGMLTKPFVLCVRLFANMTAGHIVILGFITLIFIFGNMSVGLGYAVSPVSVLFSVFISALECLVCFIQAYVFAMLSTLYIAMATEEHHEEHEIEKA